MVLVYTRLSVLESVLGVGCTVLEPDKTPQENTREPVAISPMTVLYSTMVLHWVEQWIHHWHSLRTEMDFVSNRLEQRRNETMVNSALQTTTSAGDSATIRCFVYRTNWETVLMLEAHQTPYSRPVSGSVPDALSNSADSFRCHTH